MMRRVLNKQFFSSTQTTAIAKKLLGKFLVRKYRGKTKTYMITEVEVYDGFQDKASHAYRGKTERNQIMFGEAGHWYIYFTYGMHWMLNIVSGPKDYPAAILIRSIIPTFSHGEKLEYNGPAKLTKALYIDQRLNNKPANRKTSLWIEDRGIKLKASQIKKAGRVGINYAGPVWSEKKYRFLID